MALTSLNRVKGALGIPAGVTVRDARITEIIDEVEDDLLNRVGLTNWVLTTYTAKLDVDGIGRVALLPHLPVTSVVALTNASVPLTEDLHFRLDDGGVLRSLTGGFYRGMNALDVTYVAGVIVTPGTTPGSLAKLATLSAARQANQEGLSGVESMNVRPTSKTLANPSGDAARMEINRLLAKYVRTP
jgi:hypothetical protein